MENNTTAPAHAPTPFSIGGRYGDIGYEIVGGGESICVVNRVGANRLDFLKKVRSQRAERGTQAHDAEQEAQHLEAKHVAAKAYAEFIVRACNNHDALTAQLRELIETAETVVANWETGKLAEAVNNLRCVAGEAQLVLDEANGQAA